MVTLVRDRGSNRAILRTASRNSGEIAWPDGGTALAAYLVMRRTCFVGSLAFVLVVAPSLLAQTLTPAPTVVSAAQLANLQPLEDKLISVTEPVRHSDSPQLFTIGAPKEIHV